MFTLMIVRAWDDRVSGARCPSAAFIAARTSGGRSVDVLMMSSRMLPKNSGNMAQSINTPGVIFTHRTARRRDASAWRRCLAAIAAPERWRRRARPTGRHTPVPAARSRPARRARTGTSGRCPTRSWTPSASPKGRWWPTSAPAAAGSRSGSPGASARTASSTPRTSSRPCSRRPRGASRRTCRRTSTTCGRVLGTSTDPMLPADSLDAVLIVDTYHELRTATRCASCENVTKALKPRAARRHRRLQEGRRRPRPGRPGGRTRRRSSRRPRQAGLRLLQRETFLPFQFFLIFVK